MALPTTAHIDGEPLRPIVAYIEHSGQQLIEIPGGQAYQTLYVDLYDTLSASRGLKADATAWSEDAMWKGGDAVKPKRFRTADKRLKVAVVVATKIDATPSDSKKGAPLAGAVVVGPDRSVYRILLSSMAYKSMPEAKPALTLFKHMLKSLTVGQRGLDRPGGRKRFLIDHQTTLVVDLPKGYAAASSPHYDNTDWGTFVIKRVTKDGSDVARTMLTISPLSVAPTTDVVRPVYTGKASETDTWRILGHDVRWFVGSALADGGAFATPLLAYYHVHVGRPGETGGRDRRALAFRAEAPTAAGWKTLKAIARTIAVPDVKSTVTDVQFHGCLKD
jgi:hypothetical protein